jgi:hypothetical protein
MGSRKKANKKKAPSFLAKGLFAKKLQLDPSIQFQLK